jgi:energy-converting hydrogenase B subunit D
VETLRELNWALDGLLAISALWLAGRALVSTDLFRAVVLFIAFGLVLSLIWVRLDAPDVALAEAAIGAGLTGALLLSTLLRLERRQVDPRKQGKRMEGHSDE